MPGKTVLIIGGGWGGLAVAHNLRGLLPEEHRVVVIEKKDTFSLCLANLWIMTGARSYPRDVERPMAKLARPGITWVHQEVRRIEPQTRTVHTDAGALQGDYLIIALGTEVAPQAVPGFSEAAYDVYDHQGAMELQRALADFAGGKVVILITRTPYRCPAAPYEAAFLVDELFRKRGLRQRVDIAVYTPERQPMPVGGPAVGEALRGMLAEKGINYYPERSVSGIDSASRKIVFGAEEASYDLLIGVPPHKAPQVVVAAGLTDASGYIPTHPQTLQILSDPDTLATRYPGVFAIGDVAAIRLLNQMLLPKAGVFAEAEARIVAENIAAEIKGEEAAARFDGRGGCYVEVGDGMAAYGYGNLYAYPAPSFALEPPSIQYRRDKEEYERVLENWFAP